MAKSAVIAFPRPLDGDWEPLEEAQGVVEEAVGRVVPLLDLGLLSVNAGLAVVGAAGAGTSLPATRVSVDLVDAYCDQARLIVHAQNSAAGPRTIQLYDTTNSVVLATADITNTLTTIAGAWSPIVVQGAERVLEVRVVGNGAETQTLYSIHAQLRTISFQP